MSGTDKIGEMVKTGTGLFNQGVDTIKTVGVDQLNRATELSDGLAGTIGDASKSITSGVGSAIDTGKSMFDNLNIGDNVSNIVHKTENMVGGLKDQIMEPVSTTSKALKEGAALLKATDTKVMNAISDFSSNVYKNINNLVGALSGGMLNADELKNFVSFQNGKPVLNEQAFYGKLRQQLGFDVRNIDGFSQQLISQTYQKYNRATGGFLGKVTDLNGKKISFTSNFSDSFGFNSISFLSSMQRDWRDVKDNNIINTFFDTTFDYVTKAGLTSGYETVFAQYTDKEDAKLSLLSCIGNIIYNGDIDGLIKACQLVRGVGSPDVFGVNTPATGIEGISIIRASYPNLIRDFLKRFRIYPSLKHRSKTIFKDQITGILAIIFGTTWYNTKVLDDLPAYDLSKIEGISKDSVTILSMVPELVPLLICRNNTKDILAVNKFKKDFPKAPIL